MTALIATSGPGLPGCAHHTDVALPIPNAAEPMRSQYRFARAECEVTRDLIRWGLCGKTPMTPDDAANLVAQFEERILAQARARANLL